MTRPPLIIDLNADVGEFPDRLDHDEALAGCLTSINIACGGHAGDETTMGRMAHAAARIGLVVAAHPSYPDREHFGRRSMTMAPADLAASVAGQVGALVRAADGAGVRVTRVKPHGALYHAASFDREVAGAILAGVDASLPGAILVAQAGSRAATWWREAGCTVLEEAFADRLYEPDGSLRDRARPGALLDSPGRVAAQALRLARGEGVVASDGSVISIMPGTICLHADTPGALDNARAVVAALRA